MESLAGLKVLHPEIEGFSVTAGNSSGINDAAAVVALASPDTQQNVLASVLSWTQVGLDPTRTGSGPITAIPKALALAGRKLEDVALFEINEAFAAQAVACARGLGLDEEIVNVYGSGISLGHPIAATGARMVTSAIYELRRRGGGIGVLSMCAGGGLFRVDGDRAVLLGSRRRSTGVVKFPAERPELFDGSPDTQADIEPLELSTEGTLYTFTTQEFPPPLPYKGNRDPKTFLPYIVGFVELEEGLLVESLIIDATAGDLRIGQPMVSATTTLETEAGESFLTFAFRPA
jgi:uncharacterized OB-fold protein